MPVLIGSVGIYYGNYSWMVALPMMLCFYFGAPSLVGRWRTAFVSILVLGLVMVSFKFGKRLPGLAKEAERRQQVTATLATFLPKGGAVAADFPLYYQLVDAGYGVYPRVKADEGLCLGFEQDHFLPNAVRGQISCVVTKNKTLQPSCQALAANGACRRRFLPSARVRLTMTSRSLSANDHASLCRPRRHAPARRLPA